MTRESDARWHALGPRGEVSFELQEQLTNLNAAIVRRTMERSPTNAECRNYNIQTRINIQYDTSNICEGCSVTGLLHSHQLLTARAADKLERGHRTKNDAEE